MKSTNATGMHRLPSVDEVARQPVSQASIERFGRAAFVDAVRKVLAEVRAERGGPIGGDEVAFRAHASLADEDRASLRPVFNLTGTILHTNLGRALIAEAAISAATEAMRNAVTLEFDLGDGRRGERDDHLRALLCELSGAEDATVVNNNAAAVLLVLNTLAQDRDVVVSRGELIEIGGAFRMPEIMARAGARLVEVGTTNRTHRKDYVGAISPQTGLILKVHTSNYRVEGFTAEVSPRELAVLAKDKSVPLMHDLGSGTLIDLTRFGLRHEPTVAEAVKDGADVVTFSGDKLLGGPQTGFVVGRKDLIAQINRNPMKRALRIDKIRIAALEATLKLYRDPDSLTEKLPTVRLFARRKEEIKAVAERMKPALAAALGPGFAVEIVDSASQVGSGALPLEGIPSVGLAIRSRARRSAVNAVSTVLRRLPMPVIGHIADHALVLDMRCLEDEAAFVRNLSAMDQEALSDALAR